MNAPHPANVTQLHEDSSSWHDSHEANHSEVHWSGSSMSNASIDQLPHAKEVRRQILDTRLRTFQVIVRPAVQEFENEIVSMMGALMQALSTDDTSDDREVDMNFWLEVWSRWIWSWKISKRNNRLASTIKRLFDELEKHPDLLEDLRKNSDWIKWDLTLRNVFSWVQERIKEKGFRLDVVKYGDSGCPIEFELYIYDHPLRKWTVQQLQSLFRITVKVVTIPFVVYDHLKK